MSALISMVDIVALLSTYNAEGAPKIIQEALVTGTPCIGSSIPGIRHAFGDIPGCLIVDPPNSQAYTNAVRQLIGTKDPVDRDAAVKAFDLEENYAKIGAIYAELATPNFDDK
jgi:glycosyltransferase involved in cell wall biosynthesis